MKLSDRHRVLSTFKKAIALNEEFKKAVRTKPLAEVNRARRTLEEFENGPLRLELSECVGMLEVQKDTALAFEFLTLLISFENSADEGLSYSLATAYYHNPDLIGYMMTRRSIPERTILFNSVSWGLRMMAPELPRSDSTMVNRLRLLKDLKQHLKRR